MKGPPDNQGLIIRGTGPVACHEHGTTWAVVLPLDGTSGLPVMGPPREERDSWWIDRRGHSPQSLLNERVEAARHAAPAMGHAFALSACSSCAGSFTYNPVKVPSVVVLSGQSAPTSTAPRTSRNGGSLPAGCGVKPLPAHEGPRKQECVAGVLADPTDGIGPPITPERQVEAD